jgi:hypothetical protein
LLDAADGSLHRAAESGGNTVVMLEGGAYDTENVD